MQMLLAQMGFHFPVCFLQLPCLSFVNECSTYMGVYGTCLCVSVSVWYGYVCVCVSVRCVYGVHDVYMYLCLCVVGVGSVVYVCL